LGVVSAPLLPLQRLELAPGHSESVLWRPIPFPVTRTQEMSKKDLIDAVSETAELSKDKAGQAVEAMIKYIEKTMKDGQEVRIPGFGTFKVANRAARKARNPQTGMEMMLKASRVPKFQASKTLKDMLN